MLVKPVEESVPVGTCVYFPWKEKLRVQNGRQEREQVIRKQAPEVREEFEGRGQ